MIKDEKKRGKFKRETEKEGLPIAPTGVEFEDQELFFGGDVTAYDIRA